MNRFFISVYFRPFFGKLPTISEYSKKTFFLESVFAEVRNSGLQDCNVREKRDSFGKVFWGSFEFL